MGGGVRGGEIVAWDDIDVVVEGIFHLETVGVKEKQGCAKQKRSSGSMLAVDNSEER